MAQRLKPACNAGDLGSIPGSGKFPGEGNGNPLHYSCLENPMGRGAWWATVHGVAKSQTRLSDFTFTSPGTVLVMGSGLILTCKTPSFQRQLQRGTFQGISKGRGPLNKNPIWCGGIKTETLVSHITCMVDMGHEHEQTPGNMVNKLVTPELTG